MKNRSFIITTSLLLILSSIEAKAQLSLHMEISGISSDSGFIMLQIMDEKEIVVNQAKGVISTGRCSIKIGDLKPGMYAIQYFHDENLNGIFDMNKLGIPREGFGFSNNAYGMFGPKPYEERLFKLERNMTLRLKIKY